MMSDDPLSHQEMLKEPMYALGMVLMDICRLSVRDARILLERAKILNEHRLGTRIKGLTEL
jgi:hypothetical protein